MGSSVNDYAPVKISELGTIADAMKENGISRLRINGFEIELASYELMMAAQERVKAQMTPEQREEFEKRMKESRRPPNMHYWSSGGKVSR